MTTRKALNIALVRGAAFAIVTAVYLLIGGAFGGYLWCVYVGFFLTMAFGAAPQDLPNYLCSLLAGYAWAAVYVYRPYSPPWPPCSHPAAWRPYPWPRPRP